jgi:lambda family phage tail tape measure protein
MATNQVNINLSLQDQAGSIKQRTEEVKNLNKELLKSQGLATGTKTGSAAVSASYSAAGQNIEYGRVRGAMGSTGAAGRDFANQAQGLGGLVRLYATYAANIFAVSAAFRALSDAMDTTNMIQGLNQLGAQSGLALGTLAKNFATASGGAISLREAMEATAKGTSAGLSSKQLMQLGAVASSASKALGVNMSDAVSRLTRGITKLEPELLDELGIFTKVGKATEDYAKSVGKTEAQLTDFEKRQAFANAVLKEGADKFGAVNIEANPYDKLTASLKDLAQNGLEKVNKLLVPLISALSSSPAALTAGIVGLGAMIIKQALPAIGEYRKSLDEAASRANEIAKYRATEAGKAALAQAQAREDVLDRAAETEKKKVAEASKALAAARDSGFTKSSKAFKILQKNAEDVTKEELSYLKKLEDQYRTQGKESVADRYKGAIDAINGSAKAEINYKNKVEETNKQLDGKASKLTALGRAQAAAKRTADIATSKAITSVAAENTQIMGVSEAWKEMRKSVKESDMGPIRKTFTTLASGISIATTALTGLIGAFQTYFFIAGAVVAGFKILDSLLTKNAEQYTKFTSAVDASNDAIKTYNDTMAALAKKDPTSMFNAESLTARANAIMGLADSLSALRDTYAELDKATGGWDKATNWLSKLWGGDKETKFAESAAGNIAKQISSITNEADRLAMTAKVNTALGTENGGQLAWIEALKKGGPDAINAIKGLEGEFKKLGTEAANIASRSTEFNESLKAVQTSYRAFAFASADKSPIAKLGDDMLNLSVKMSGALVDPIAGLSSMKKLLEESTTVGIFDPTTVAQLQSVKNEINDLAKSQGEVTQQLIKGRQELDTIQLAYDTIVAKQAAYTKANQSDAATNALVGDTGKKLADKLVEVAKLNQKDTENREKIIKAMENPVFAKLTIEAFKTGSELILQNIKRGFEQSTIDLKKGILATMSGLPGSASLEYGVSIKESDLQRQLLRVQQSMLRAQYLQTAALIANTAAIEVARTGDTRDARDRSMGMVDAGAGSSERARAEEFSNMSRRFTELVNNPGTKNSQQFIRDAGVAMEKFGDKAPAYNTQLKTMVDAAKGFLETQVDLSKLDTKDKLAALTKQRNIIEEQRVIAQSRITIEKSGLDLQQQALALVVTQNGYLTQDQLLQQKINQDRAARLDLDSAILDIAAEIDKYEKSIAMAKTQGLYTEAGDLETRRLFAIKAISASAAYTSKLDQNTVNTKIATNKLLADEEAKRLNILGIQQETDNIRATTSIELDKLQLDFRTKALTLTDQQIADQKYQIELDSLQAETTQKLASIDLKYMQDKNRLQEKLANAVPDSQAARDAQAELDAITTKKDVEINSIRNVSSAKRAAADQDAQYSERQKAYGQAFEDSFKGMADAIVEFTKTGKLNFTSMINTMIEALLRYELQQQAMMLHTAARPGFMDFIGSIFGNGVGKITANPYRAQDLAGGSVIGASAAQGAVYDVGLQKFAKGGMFTNSVVNSPTLFKFAKGTGLMGEAGPEAIMPLKRDNNGNLGVRGGGGGSNVDVVVNNYGSEKATTKETTDNQGNRKIEVIIGDMVAGQMSRQGSAVQQSLSSTFGTRPVVPRR